MSVTLKGTASIGTIDRNGRNKQTNKNNDKNSNNKSKKNSQQFMGGFSRQMQVILSGLLPTQDTFLSLKLVRNFHSHLSVILPSPPITPPPPPSPSPPPPPPPSRLTSLICPPYFYATHINVVASRVFETGLGFYIKYFCILALPIYFA